jgi:hypothetical protein
VSTNPVIPVSQGALLGRAERDKNGDVAARDLAYPLDRVNDQRATLHLSSRRQADIAAAWPISNLTCEQAGLVGGAR